MLFLPTRWFLCILACIAMEGRVCAADYLTDVKPLLEHKCYACHGALKQQGGLRLDTAVSLVAGGDSGSTISTDNVDDSLLIGVLTGEAGFQMPPASEGAALDAEQIETIRQWIAAGAPLPESEAPQADPSTWWSYQAIQRPQLLPDVKDLAWCRTPVDRFVAASREARGLLPVAEAPKPAWLRRVYIDLIGLPPTSHELHEFLEDESSTAHEKVVDDLLSRPQYGERWGRHWMDVWRYSDWYGSRGGNEIRYSQRHIWRWRDWIIDSLNADKGYDQMILEMLAADEFAGDDPSVLPATGFLGRNWYKFDRDAWLFETVERTGEAFLGLTLRCCRCHDHKFDPISQEEYYRFRAFFEPHDVRIDPISALTGTEKDATLGQVLLDGIPRVYDKSLETPTYRFERGDNRHPDKSRELAPGVPAALGGALEVRPVTLPTTAWYPALRPGMHQSLIAKAERSTQQAKQTWQQAMQAAVAAAARLSAVYQLGYTQPLERHRNRIALWEHQGGEEFLEMRIGKAAALLEARKRIKAQADQAVAVAAAELALAQAELESLRARLSAELAKYIELNSQAAEHLAVEACQAERTAAVRQAQLSIAAAQSDEQRSQAEQALLAATEAAENESNSYSPVGDQFPQTSSGRRLALAKWIASPNNPRTARVAANHIWTRHFGQPLVATPENFGLNGRQPTHPELLNWLAAELIDGDWRMKSLHKQLVLSATYRMSSALQESQIAEQNQLSVSALSAYPSDPDNQFLWRMNSQRAEAEVVRDSILFVAGRLDMSLGGPELAESEGEKTLRRSLYFRNTPNEKMPMLEVFDMADPNGCYLRKASTVPHQSLAIMNSGLALDSARGLTERLLGEPDFVGAAFATILNRPPTAQERQRCNIFLSEHAQQFGPQPKHPFSAGGSATRPPSSDPAIRAQENLVHVLLLHNDFVTVR